MLHARRQDHLAPILKGAKQQLAERPRPAMMCPKRASSMFGTSNPLSVFGSLNGRCRQREELGEPHTLPCGLPSGADPRTTQNPPAHSLNGRSWAIVPAKIAEMCVTGWPSHGSPLMGASRPQASGAESSVALPLDSREPHPRLADVLLPGRRRSERFR